MSFTARYGTQQPEAGRERQFATIRAALRRQSLTHEPYSGQVIAALWDLVQKRRAEHDGDTRVLRRELQAELIAALSPDIDRELLSKNKVNKIFQVLIRSCFTLLSRDPTSARALLMGPAQSAQDGCEQTGSQVNTNSALLPDQAVARQPSRGEVMFGTAVQDSSLFPDVEGVMLGGAICELLPHITSLGQMVHAHNSLIVRVGVEAGINMSR